MRKNNKHSRIKIDAQNIQIYYTLRPLKCYTVYLGHRIHTERFLSNRKEGSLCYFAVYKRQLY